MEIYIGHIREKVKSKISAFVEKLIFASFLNLKAGNNGFHFYVFNFCRYGWMLTWNDVIVVTDGIGSLAEVSRTTMTPAFWGYPRRPMITHTTEQFILDPKSKQDKAKVTHLKNLASIIEDTERTRFYPQTDRRTNKWTDGRTDRRMDKVKPV